MQVFHLVLNFEAANQRKVKIENDQIGSIGFDGAQGGQAVRGLRDLKACGP